MMQKITLNRKQIDKLVEFVVHFKYIEKFTIECNTQEENDEVRIRCSLFDNTDPETTVYIKTENG